MLKALIFDFDGVIGDTYDLNYTLSRLFDPGISKQYFEDHHNGNVWAEPKIKITPEEVKILFQKQRELFTKDHLFPMRTLLETFSKDHQIFIVSSSLEENIEYVLGLWGYDVFINRILWVDTHRSKVEKFKIIFESYGLKSEECVFITDTIGDIKEWRHFSLTTIAVTWWYHPRELLESEHPYALADTIDELWEIIEKLC